MHINAKGLLFISQARLTSRVIHSRTDGDFRFTALGKLRDAFEIANHKDLAVVLLGNLFEKPRETDPRILSGLFSLMAQAKHKPICLANAEELKNSGDLIDDVTLAILASTQLATIITRKGVAGSLTVDGREIDVWASPYGEIDPGIRFERQTICITHDVMTAPCSAIDNVVQVINGYSTGVGRSEEVDGTHWLFPESISRLTIDEQFNVPVAWAWTPDTGITRKAIEYRTEVFSDEEVQTESIAMLPNSLFVELLKEEIEDDLEIDNSVAFKGDMEELMDELVVSEPARLILLDLIKRASAEKLS